jgi:hypothetical protein
MNTTTPIPDAVRKDIYSGVQRRMERWYGPSHANGRACLYWMHAGLVTLSQRGITAYPAAGTAYFQFRPGPDGSKDTHFGFEWQGPDAGRRFAPGESLMPEEIHCWIWLPHHMEVVDFSAGHVPVLAKEMGFEWEIEPPPPFVWGDPRSLLPRFVYYPFRDATQLAMANLIASKKGTR